MIVQFGRAGGVAVLLAAVGCGAKGPTIHPVQGRVELTGGNVQAIAGYNVECALEADMTVRSSGRIGPDGGFALHTASGGKIQPGALEGKYLVRLVPGDDEGGRPKAKTQLVHQRFLDFKSSGLTLQVPQPGVVVLTVSAK